MITQSEPTKQQASAAPPARADVVVICALHRPELSAIVDVLKTKPMRIEGDPIHYQMVDLATTSGTISVVAAAPNFMGPSSAAALATKMILRFRPTVVIMPGIAAGARQKEQALGDVVIPDVTFSHDAGKLEEGSDGTIVFKLDPQPLSINQDLISRLKADEHVYNAYLMRARLEYTWQDSPPAAQHKIHVGNVGTADKVIDSNSHVEEIRRHWRKLIGIEMEYHAVHLACQTSDSHKPLFVGCKSICDFASAKGDDWQAFAAFMSAQFTRSILLDEWEFLSSLVR